MTCPACAAADELVLVTQAEAQSVLETYRLVKRLTAVCGRRRTNVLINRMRIPAQADRFFGNLSTTAARFLSVTLELEGRIPNDDCVERATQLRQIVVEAFPGAPSSKMLRNCAETILRGPESGTRQGGVFAGRLIAVARTLREPRKTVPPVHSMRGNHAAKQNNSGIAMASPMLTTDQNKLVQQMAPLVKRIAYHFMARLPASVHVDDLIQAGLMGLLDAAKNFDDTQGAQFETYAIQRIRGSILDELRQADWLPRNVRKNLRRIEGTISAMEQRLGRIPREQELAEALGVPLDEYQTMLLESRGYQLLHYEDFQESEDSDFFDVFMTDNQVGPLDVLEDQRFRKALVQAIGVLPEREKLVMGLYYEQEMNLKEIGEVLGVSESRVCQLHSQAVVRLRARLKGYTQKQP